jgi:acyl carrier protein
MEEKILQYLFKLFGEESSAHYSYCKAPFEDCCCKRLPDIGLDTPLISGGYIDSFSMVAVLMFLEKEFSIKISDADGVPSNFDTVNSMVELVKRYQ